MTARRQPDGSHDDGNNDGNNDDGHDDGHHDGNHDDGDGDDDGGNCATTAKLTLNKVVVNDNGGTATVADFTLVATSSVGGVDVISGPDPAAGSPVGISATVPVTDTYVLSESGPDGYTASAWSCSAGTLAGDTLTLAAGDNANCTITNDDVATPPTPSSITLVKFLGDPLFGGTAAPGDFQLLIDGIEQTQTKHTVDPGRARHQ